MREEEAGMSPQLAGDHVPPACGMVVPLTVGTCALCFSPGRDRVAVSLSSLPKVTHSLAGWPALGAPAVSREQMSPCARLRD